MKRQLPPLLAVRAFEAAARHLSFSRAAEELNVTQGAISRQIKALESYLHQPLFHRLTRRVELTVFGHAYFETVGAALGEIERASVDARSPRSTLRVSVPQSLAAVWLMPRIGSFNERHRDIDVRVTASLAPVDFAHDDVDVAIRLGRLPGRLYEINGPRVPHAMVRNWDGVIAEHLCDEILTPVLSRRMLEAGPPLRDPRDLRHYPLIGVALRPDAWSDWFRTLGQPMAPGGVAHEVGHFFMALDAALKHRGVALAPTLHIDSLPDRDRLVCPFDSRVRSAGEYCLLYRQRHAGDGNIRKFREWLLEQQGQ